MYLLKILSKITFNHQFYSFLSYLFIYKIKCYKGHKVHSNSINDKKLSKKWKKNDIKLKIKIGAIN